SKIFDVPAEWLRPDATLLLDLGRVGDIAEVSVNGRAVGLLWKAPYHVDVTGALHAGKNRLEIKITNQWTNRILGDRVVAADKKVLNVPPPAGPGAGFGGGGALPESGLIGPVRILGRE
ncbi:MAG TPA: hypothetical protein VHF69_07910, partial [Candidatus Synoicihabitans sp.]|nr:hypothetical protein [Candidatus Synoicihabitans sp.]